MDVVNKDKGNRKGNTDANDYPKNLNTKLIAGEIPVNARSDKGVEYTDSE